MSSVNHWKSARASYTPQFKVICLLLTWRGASCICLKRPHASGRASNIERSSPRQRCHLSTLMHFWVAGILARIFWKRSAWCDGNDIIMLIVSTTHPRRSFQVDHEQSPASKFFRNRTSFRSSMSIESRGRNTWSKVWNKVRRTWRQRYRGTCASPRKSSTNTSIYWRSWKFFLPR